LRLLLALSQVVDEDDYYDVAAGSYSPGRQAAVDLSGRLLTSGGGATSVEVRSHSGHSFATSRMAGGGGGAREQAR